MTNINRLIQDLQCEDLELRYEACKQLHSASQLPYSALVALRQAASEPEPLIATSARRIINNEELVIFDYTNSHISKPSQSAKSNSNTNKKISNAEYFDWLIYGLVAYALALTLIAIFRFLITEPILCGREVFGSWQLSIGYGEPIEFIDWMWVILISSPPALLGSLFGGRFGYLWKGSFRWGLPAHTRSIITSILGGLLPAIAMGICALLIFPIEC